MASTLTISWTAPTPCVGCTYEYQYKLSSDSAFISGSTSNTSVVISSLTDGATYNYQVRTVCGPVRSLWSTSSTVTCDTAPTPAPTVAPTETPAPTVAPTTPPTTPAPTVAPCGAPTISSVTRSGLNDISVGFTTSNGCVATHLEYSLDNSSWSSQNSGGCTSPRTITVSPNNQSIVYVRMRQSCQGVDYSSYSNVFTLAAVVTQTPEPTPEPTSIPITNCVRLVKTRPMFQPDCSLTKIQRVTVTLYDSTGATEVDATYDITVTLGGTGDDGEPTTWDLVIASGESSAYDDIVVAEQTSGECDERDDTAVTRLVGGISSISDPSIVECEAVAPPEGTILNEFYYGQGLLTQGAHCGTNYTINASFFSSATIISGLLNQTIYTTNTASAAFNGNNLWYPVALESDTNTLNGQYWVILIDSNGTVQNIVFIDSSCDENTP
jgi:hypothetical protein